jgi:hypothetical protein
MDNELLYAKIAAMEGNALWPPGGRDDEPGTLALLYSLLWSVLNGAVYSLNYDVLKDLR